MAVSKRKRYEVFRRDSFTCRYCGAAAPDVELTIDHVTPQALVDRVAAAAKTEHRPPRVLAGDDEPSTFPEFDLTCDYVRRLAEALGADDHVGKFADSRLGTALSAAQHVWNASEGSEDQWDRTWTAFSQSVGDVLRQVARWREERDVRRLQQAPPAEFNPMNLADSFLTELMMVLDVPAEQRAAAHHAYWDAMQEANRVYLAGDAPDGSNLGEWVAEQFDNVVAAHLYRLGNSETQILTTALARHYVRRMLERAGANEDDIAESIRAMPYVLGRGAREFAEVAQRHVGISDDQALSLVHTVMDEQLAADLGVASADTGVTI